MCLKTPTRFMVSGSLMAGCSMKGSVSRASTVRCAQRLLDCCDFRWAKISPAVFGSLFQGVMDDRARRQQGAHYTSERDIMKVLRSLFLDDLRAEWQRLKEDRSSRRLANQNEFHQRFAHSDFSTPPVAAAIFLSSLTANSARWKLKSCATLPPGGRPATPSHR